MHKEIGASHMEKLFTWRNQSGWLGHARGDRSAAACAAQPVFGGANLQEFPVGSLKGN